jgi:single-strand DNA-binding protein
VLVQGRLKSRQYETREGEKRTVFEIDVDEIGPSLRNATAKVNKTTRSGSGNGSSSFGGSGGGGNDPWATSAPSSSAPASSGGGNDPWAASGGGSVEDPPF